MRTSRLPTKAIDGAILLSSSSSVSSLVLEWPWNDSITRTTAEDEDDFASGIVDDDRLDRCYRTRSEGAHFAVYAGRRVRGPTLTLVVELFAPGFFASAATFDIPDPQGVLLMPPTAHPMVSSEDIDGVSYSVQRHELFAFPKRGGSQTIPSLPVRFAFKRSPLDQAKISASVTTDPVEFTVVLPPGAEGLGNVISARNLKVEETWQPELGKTTIKPGDAFTRTIIFSAPNLPGMVFPPFPADSIDGLGVYAKHQILDQTERGQLRGERRDVITYVFQRSGEFTIPAARLTWWDLDNKQLQSVDFPAHVFSCRRNSTANVFLEAAREVETSLGGFDSAWRSPSSAMPDFVIFSLTHSPDSVQFIWRH